MQSKLSVSIIIPNYNHALFLKQRIDSVINQTFQDFEVIILDDCSKDQSKDIIEQYRQHPKVSKILYNTENSGSVFKQWIKGIENAKGEYIWIAESDDFAFENFIEETIGEIQKDHSLGMVFTNSHIVNSENKALGFTADDKKERYNELLTHHNLIDHKNVVPFLLSDMIISNASSVLFRKSSLLEIDFNELSKFINTGDRFVYMGIALNSKIQYIPLALNYMRSHENNTTKKSMINGNIYKDRIKVLNYYFNTIYNSLSSKSIVNFYKPNYISYVTFGEYKDNIEVLKKLKNKSEITYRFYCIVKLYLYLFRKINFKSKIIRGLYYRMLPPEK